MSRSLSHFFGDNVLLGSRARKPVKQFEVVEEPKKTTKKYATTVFNFSSNYISK
jgi:hypothetical protein